MKRILLLNFIVYSLSVFAVDEDCVKKIILTPGSQLPRAQVISSGRDPDVFPKIEIATAEIMGPGGLLDSLDVKILPQIIQFMPGYAMNGVVGTNRYPIGHWIDGANVKQGVRGVLEIVIPGLTKLHSMYRDDIDFEKQISILFHVIGHAIVITNNRFIKERAIDLLTESWALHEWTEELKNKYGSDEVSEWYQYLNSMKMSQDVVLSDWEDPSKFAFSDADRKNYFFQENMRQNHPKSPTQNILQAYVANLPNDIQPWKKEMAIRFERLNRYLPGLMHTKIMNEGFATLMQEILPKHTKYSTFSHNMHWCCLMGSHFNRNINNPYWLGLQVWRRYYKLFTLREDIKNLPSLEQDKRFIAESVKKIIFPMQDMMFLNAYIDESWIAQNNFYLRRMLPKNEEDWNLPLPNPPIKSPRQFQVVSRDFERVRKAIVVGQKSFAIDMPVPYLTQINNEGSGEVFYDMRDPVGIQLPLDKADLVKTLFIHSRLWNRPVTIEATVGKIKNPWEDDERMSGWWGNWGGKKEVILTRVRVTVDRYGNLKVVKVLRDGSANPKNVPHTELGIIPKEKSKITFKEDEKLKKEFSKPLNGFIAELAIGNHSRIHSQTQDHKRTHQILMEAATTGGSAYNASAMLHVPTMPHALDAFYRFVGSRLTSTFKLAMQDDNFWKRLSNGVRLKVLPDVPGFSFDQKALELIFENMKAPPVDVAFSHLGGFLDSYQGDIGTGGQQPGDKYWDRGPRKGKGSGNGDDDGDDGDDADGEDGDDAGRGGADPTFLDIPLDLYAKLLNEEINLPNLRPKAGKVQHTDTRLRGHLNQKNGIPVNSEISKNAFKRGLSSLLAEGQETPPEEGALKSLPKISKIMRRGYSLLRNRDWVVENEEVKKTPDINAVIIMALDMSGSMMNVEDLVKKMFFDLRAILMHKYKKLEFRFIAFDDGATVFDDFHKFLKARLGGGTYYNLAFKKAAEVQKEFPENKWDRYVIIAGDLMDSATDEAKQSFEKMAELSSYSAVLRSTELPMSSESGWGWEEFFSAHYQKDPYFGFVDVSPPETYNVKIFRELFRNEKK